MPLFQVHCSLEVKERGNFSFKSFTVRQENAAMPVTTDACIFGAYAEFSQETSRILDIGTGTGLLSLMLAQRYATAEITGIDIQEDSVLLAESNFKASPWAHRLGVIHADLQDFTSDQAFDGIICNPPFFENQLASEETGKRISRHTVSLTYDALFRHSQRLLAPEGTAWYLLPTVHEQRIIELLQEHGLSPFHRADLHSNSQKTAHLFLLGCRKSASVCQVDSLYTYGEQGQLTHRVSALLQPFYLHL